MISVYRGITGRGSYNAANDEYIYSGVSELDEYGISCSNRSYMQANRFGGIDDMRRVDGLPVFLNEREAVDWLRRKKYRNPDDLNKGLGVLACAAIDEELIANRRVIIIRNMLNMSLDDQELTLEQLIAHRDGVMPISGECYMPSFPKNSEQVHSTFMIPRAHTMDGQIDFAVNPTFINIAELT